MSKKSSIIITAIVTLVSFFTITWLSCKKPSYPYSCNNLVCLNGANCYTDSVNIPHCACPSGYEGPTCATASVNKFLGTWDLKQRVSWSDSANNIGSEASYEVLLSKTATTTTFFMNNFFNNSNYNNIICNIDSTYTYNFAIDTLSDMYELYDHYQIKWGAGYISNNTINGSMLIRFKNATSNWQRDSIYFVLTPHTF